MRTSICDWNLRASFKRKEQVVKAIRKILDEPIDYDVSFSTELTATETLYVIEIHNMSWAANLRRIGKILDSVDEKI